MAKTEKSVQETPQQMNQRVKKRKWVYTETYPKGLFMADKKKLVDWINQSDEVVVRVHKGGQLDDGTEAVNISIEGFLPDKPSEQ